MLASEHAASRANAARLSATVLASEHAASSADAANDYFRLLAANSAKAVDKIAVSSAR